MNIIEGVVSKILVSEPKEGKYGKFHNVALILDGEVDEEGKNKVFSSFSPTPDLQDSEDKSKKVSIGSTVKFLFEENIKDGKTYLNVDKKNLRILSQSTVSFPTVQTSTQNNTQQKNTQGQIKGNSVSNGVQLAIARHGKNVTIDHVEAATLEVLDLHKKLDSAE